MSCLGNNLELSVGQKACEQVTQLGDVMKLPCTVPSEGFMVVPEFTNVKYGMIASSQAQATG